MTFGTESANQNGKQKEVSARKKSNWEKAAAWKKHFQAI